MTASRCSKSRPAFRRALGGALAIGLVSLLAIPGALPALGQSSQPTELGVPAATGGSSGSGIESAPLPPLQPAPGTIPSATGTTTGTAVPPSDTTTYDSPIPQTNTGQPATNQPAPTQPAAQPTISEPVMGQPTPPLPGAMPAATAMPGGLGGDLWQGSEVSRLMILVPRLPAPVTVPSLRDLQVRTLMTESGDSSGVDPLQSLRADKLYQMGFNDAALDLAQGSAPAASTGDPRESFERLLADNNDAAACQQADAILAGGQALDDFFRRAVIYCQITREQNDAASLGIGLLREGGSDDATTQDFVALAALANGETKRQPKLKAEPDAINTALMKLSGMPAGGAAIAAVVPVGIGGSLMIARDATRPLPERVKAAEQAFRYGLLPAGELGELYLQVPAGNADPATAIGMSDTAELRAQLYQEAHRSNQPARRAKAIQAAMAKAHQRGDYLNQAALYAGAADAISPDRELSFFAAEGARLAFLSGKVDKGGYWLNTVAANPNAFSRPGEREGLELLGRIAGLSGSVQNDPVAAWKAASGVTNARVDLFYALLSGLGTPAAGNVVGGFSADPIVAVGSASAEIAAAAAGKRRGETIVLVLAAINGDQAIATDPASMSTALRSLGAIGLSDDARRIAREVAVLAGL